MHSIPNNYFDFFSEIWKGRYRCSIYRSTRGNMCKASLNVTFNPAADQKLLVDTSNTVHTCQPKANASPDEDDRLRLCHGVHDAREQMRALCEEIALSQLNKTSIAIANEVLTTTALKYEEQSEWGFFYNKVAFISAFSVLMSLCMCVCIRTTLRRLTNGPIEDNCTTHAQRRIC